MIPSQSTFGSRHAACEHYHWTWEELHWGQPWILVLKMMADAPYWESGDTEVKKGNKRPAMNHDELTNNLMQKMEAMKAKSMKQQIDNIPREL